MEDAIAILNAPDDAPAPAEPAAPAPTPEAPAAPADAPPAPVADPNDKLLADLEARRLARQQKTPAVDPTVAQLQAQVAALQAKLESQPAPSKPDLQALIAEHGEVEGLRRYGIDPLQFFNGFRERAKQQNPALSKAEQDAAAARAATEALQQKYEADQRTATEREQLWYQAQTERAYHGVIESPELGLVLLPKMTPEERMDETRKAAQDLRRTRGYTEADFNEMTDGELARLTEMYVSAKIRRLTGDASATTTPKTVPATDGAKTTPAKTPVSLTNDLASQFTGGRKLEDLNDRESWSAAMSVLNSGAE